MRGQSCLIRNPELHAMSENLKTAQWLRRVGRVEIFDESAETFAGPPWAWVLAICCAAAAYLCLFGAIVSAAGGRPVAVWTVSYIAAFALLSGACWHLGARAGSEPTTGLHVRDGGPLNVASRVT